ncbi:MAG: undecaprenyldiphospho-muramoylpentapeptide beta-N-acetylglucosaminyltransferase [Bacteroidota bacterium]
MSDKARVLLAAGGTGGHVYPAIAIADALRSMHPDIELLFAGTRNHMEWEAVPKAGYPISNIWISGFHRRLTAKNLLFPVKLLTSMVQSWNMIRAFKPDVVVSCGGYVAGPVGWIAQQMNIPVVIQEQNSLPGVTNRLLAKKATKIFTAFKEAARFFPGGNIELSGNPTRSALATMPRSEGLDAFGFNPDNPTLLVMGGSGGAKSINEAVRDNLDELHHNQNLQLIWQCGSRYISGMRASVDEKQYPRLRLTEFIHNMPHAYAASDLVVSRAGASSCSEFMNIGKPSILIPSPYVAGDHQTQNARAMEDAGASALLVDRDANVKLSEMVHQYITDAQQLEAMSEAARTLAKPDAAKTIAQEILTLAQTRNN